MAIIVFAGLPPYKTEQELAEAVGNIAPVLKVQMLVDRATGRSKGIGRVEVPDERAGEVLKVFNGSHWAGKVINAAEASPLPEGE